MAGNGSNVRYLPGVMFPDDLHAVPDLAECLQGVRDILIAVPSHGLRETLTMIKPHLRDDAQAEIRQVVEGVLAAKAVQEVAGKMDVEMPICQQVYRTLYEGASPKDAVAALMGRALTSE